MSMHKNDRTGEGGGFKNCILGKYLILYMTNFFQQNYCFYYFKVRLGVRPPSLSGPSAAARTGLGARRCGHMTNNRRGAAGVQKSYTRKLPIAELRKLMFHLKFFLLL